VRVRFLTPACQDLMRAVEYYEMNSHELGRDMILDANETSDLIADFPRLGAPGPKGTRGMHLHRFPYSIIYRIGADEIVRVFALQHRRRDPESWHDRL